MKKYRIYKTHRKKTSGGNPVAKELSNPKFQQRVVNPKKIYHRVHKNLTRLTPEELEDLQ